jgi:hypothetical protein
MFFGIATVYSAPPEKKSPPDARMAESNAVPRSIFIIPTSPQESHDPFFPNANYLFAASVTKKPSSPNVGLALKAISGSADKKLAMISLAGTNRTLPEGEESEVMTSSGRVKIRCIEIKGESVVVEVGGERRELHLPSGN